VAARPVAEARAIARHTMGPNLSRMERISLLFRWR
jgi:hypothetical protein